MAEFEVTRQSSPGPTCISTNVFSGRVIAYGAATDAGDATSAAKSQATTQRNDLKEEDRIRRNNCPNTCNQNAASNASQAKDEIVQYTVDANAPLYVSYAYGAWRVSVKCPTNNNTYAPLANSSDKKVLRYPLELVCPGTRLLTGCVLAYAIDTRKASAEHTAKNLAETTAQDELDTDKGTSCPNSGNDRACTSAILSEERTAATRIWRTHEIKQAKQGSTKKYIAYYESHWKAEIQCTIVPVGKGGQQQ